MKKVLLWIVGILVIVAIISVLFILLNPVFGGRVNKADKEEYTSRATNYIDGKFVYPEEYELESGLEDNRVSEKELYPENKLTAVEPMISESPAEDQFNVTWLGHSSLLIQMHGMNILIDPVFNEHPSPVFFAGPNRFSDMAITIEELPEIDLVIFSHDHYDHLDMDTVKELDSKVKKYIVPLGVENHLEHWNIGSSKIEKLSWWEETEVNGLTIGCTPARHYSNRQFFDRGNTLFASWVLKDEYHQIYESGDSGFGGHYKEIQERYGDFEFVMMDSAQYDPEWHELHMYPEEAVLASQILGAKVSMPIHWGAYALSTHAWDDPIERYIRAAKEKELDIVTPRIGQTVDLTNYSDYQETWWRE
ncbi:MAG: MBL fold metallo-hydrolase [bacterium]|nr:MBL fold metallo-hydrolase [bacterium]